MVDLALSNLSAMAPAVIVCDASSNKIALLVGSAIAWKTSRLKIIFRHLTTNITCRYLTTKCFIEIFLR